MEQQILCLGKKTSVDMILLRCAYHFSGLWSLRFDATFDLSWIRNYSWYLLGVCPFDIA